MNKVSSFYLKILLCYPVVPSCDMTYLLPPPPRWHLGYCDCHQFPTRQGFNSYGFPRGSQNHYSHTHFKGQYDFLRGEETDCQAKGVYLSVRMETKTNRVFEKAHTPGCLLINGEEMPSQLTVPIIWI